MEDQLQTKERQEEELINAAFQDLLNCYLATKHRKKEIGRASCRERV